MSITFRHIKPALYWGFHTRRTLYGTYNLAEPEKALLDWFYLERKRGNEVITDDFDFRKLDREKVLLYAQKYPRPVKFELLESLALALLPRMAGRPLPIRSEASKAGCE